MEQGLICFTGPGRATAYRLLHIIATCVYDVALTLEYSRQLPRPFV